MSKRNYFEKYQNIKQMYLNLKKQLGGTKDKKKSEFLAKIAEDNHKIVRHNPSRIVNPVVFRHDLLTNAYNTNLSQLRNLVIRPNIILENKTTDQAIVDYANNETATLNFANGRHPGGGYIKGASAQEEDLCRQYVYLYPSLDRARQNGIYPLRSDVILYVNNIYRMRDNHYNKIPKTSYRAHTSFITADAPDLRHKTYQRATRNEIYDITEPDFRSRSKQIIKSNDISLINFINTKLDLIFLSPLFDSSYNYNPDYPKTLILGAFGCGAFTPEIGKEEYIEDLASLMVVKINMFGRLYEKIIFAIPRGNGNYEMFERVFRRYGLM